MSNQHASTSTDHASPPDPSTSTEPGKTSGVRPVLREQAEKLADRSKTAGADAAEAVSTAVESAANELEQSVPQLAGYVRNAAEYTHKMADDLRDRKAADLLTDALQWGRKQPLMALAGAAVLGFALSRVIKSGMPDDQSDAGRLP